MSMPRIAISASTPAASDQSGIAPRIAASSRAMRSCAWRTAQQHLLEGDALLGMRELLLRQPVHVRLGRRLVARIMQAEPQQERRYLLALGAQILHRRPARPGEVAHRLVARIRN